MISPSHIAAVFGFNRYIVECKFHGSSAPLPGNRDLIDT